MASNSFSKIETNGDTPSWRGMSVMGESAMRARFSSRPPKSLEPLIEKLNKLDPKSDKPAYEKTLKDYLNATRSG